MREEGITWRQDSLSVPNLSTSLGHGSIKASRHQRSWRTPLAVSVLIAVVEAYRVLPIQQAASWWPSMVFIVDSFYTCRLDVLQAFGFDDSSSSVFAFR